MGADFHRAVVATASGETPHRASPCEELDAATIFSLFHCELRLIIDVMICSLQSVNLLYLLYLFI